MERREQGNLDEAMPDWAEYLAAFDAHLMDRLPAARERMIEILAPRLPAGVGIVKHRRG